MSKIHTLKHWNFAVVVRTCAHMYARFVMPGVVPVLKRRKYQEFSHSLCIRVAVITFPAHANSVHRAVHRAKLGGVYFADMRAVGNGDGVIWLVNESWEYPLNFRASPNSGNI